MIALLIKLILQPPKKGRYIRFEVITVAINSNRFVLLNF
ncbi:hypothetical protein LLB_3674 [Legionella longbeachae D-4968]|nr:hypothetical protein LLB_3674 [Legionella longbeachae D-4968]